MLVKERSTAAGIAVGVWLLFVIVYDLALMGMLVASKGGVGAEIFPSLLLLNPADAYRLFNLTAFENVRKISGMGGLSASAQFSPSVLLFSLAAWIVVPLAACRCLVSQEASMRHHAGLAAVLFVLSACSERGGIPAVPREPGPATPRASIAA